MANKKKAFFDCECTPNYFCINFKCRETGRRRRFEFFEGHPLDRANVIRIIRSFCLIGFNIIHYDIPMLKLALRLGVTNELLKKLNDDIIVRQMNPWDVERKYDLPEMPYMDAIDLIEPMPSVKVGLKLYGGRLHSQRLQDLPYSPDAILTREQQIETCDYCDNDLDITEDAFNHIEPQLELRAQMSEQYGVDLRSKSDAQIAEAVIKKELERIKGERLFRPELPHDYSFKYHAPDFIKFETPQMQDALQVIADATFKLSKKEVREEADDELEGEVKLKVSGIALPKEIKALKLAIGSSVYQMGIGGLHSKEKHVSHYADENTIIRDADVAAYYPALILVCQIYPEHLGPDFLKVYRDIRHRRMSAKKMLKKCKKMLEMGLSAIDAAKVKGDMASAKVVDMTLKIVLNGAFGKLGSKWSVFYSPNQMIQVTLTGQLSLLMLIERLELAGIRVVSANTDGIVAMFHPDQATTYHAIVFDWEIDTGLEMEFADYKALHSASVNSYIAIKTDGEVKQKGLYSFVGSKGSPAEKNPTNYVCIDAVINYLTKGTPLEETIDWCADVRRFLTVRRVTGGASWNGQYLGKVVRWYRGRNSASPIVYAKGTKEGDKVAKSDGAVPMMELTGLPPDLDYDYYYAQSRRMLGELGVL